MRFSLVSLVFFANLGQRAPFHYVYGNIISGELCGSTSLIDLEASGAASSITFNLNPKDRKRICKLNITAPNSHIVNLQWQDEHRELLDNHRSGSSSPCPLSIFLPDNPRMAVWKGDPCLKNEISEVDLLTPQFTLIWTPPRFGFHARGRKLVVTAVGQGNTCKEEGQHTCMRIGWEPVLCVSEQLVCDGNPNCPKGAPLSDEDETLCTSHLLAHPSWQRVAEEVMRKLPSVALNSNKWLENRQPQDDSLGMTETSRAIPHITWTKVESTTDQHHRQHDDVETTSSAFSHYGPWGYLMLGMLICGTVLMFCGLWECCFHKPKPHMELQSQQPTTVLIINRTQDELIAHQPPNYDDLDQPPSYVTLFPNIKLQTVLTDVVDNSTAPTTMEDDIESSSTTADAAAVVIVDDSNEDRLNTPPDETLPLDECNTDTSRETDEEVLERRPSPTACIVTDV